MELGKAIKIILESKGLTQKDLAERTKLSQTSISLLMRGHTMPRKESLELIADALEVKPEMLLILSISKDDVPEGRKEYYDLIWPELKSSLVKLFVK